MPFLRFSRDKRGYESTYLCHSYRQSGTQELRVLYWFRTPPGVRVGRLALDPNAIRAIEEANPRLKFDWDKILKVKAPPPPQEYDREAREERRLLRVPEKKCGVSVPFRRRCLRLFSGSTDFLISSPLYALHHGAGDSGRGARA